MVTERAVSALLAVLAADRAGSLGDLPLAEVVVREPLRTLLVLRSALAGLVVQGVPPTREVTEASIRVMLMVVVAAVALAVSAVVVAAPLTTNSTAAVAAVVGRAWSQAEIRRRPKGYLPPLETVATPTTETSPDREAPSNISMSPPFA